MVIRPQKEAHDLFTHLSNLQLIQNLVPIPNQLIDVSTFNSINLVAIYFRKLFAIYSCFTIN